MSAKKTIALFIFLYLPTVCAQQQKYLWKEIPSPISQPITILNGSSKNNFSVFDGRGTIYEFNCGKWVSKTMLNKDDYLYYITGYLENKTILCGVDKDWRSHFFIYSNHHFTKEKFVYNKPLNGFSIIDGNKLYGICAFGGFIFFDGKNFKPITTNIKSHIDRCFVIDKNNVWLGTKSDGIFHFDGNSFRYFPCQDNVKHEISYFLKDDTSEISAVTTSGIYLKLLNGKFHHEDKKYVPPNALCKNPGFFTLKVNFKNSVKEVEAPVSMKIQSAKVLDDEETILVGTNNGKIYYSERINNNYFYDLTNSFNLGKSNSNYPTGLYTTDFNNDNLPDFFSTYYQSLPLIFTNNDFTFSQDLVKDSTFNKQYVTADIVGDVDRDGFADLIVSNYHECKSFINIYLNKSNNFEKSQTLKMPGKIGERQIKSMTLTDWDKDGDLDLLAIFYLGPGSETGGVVAFENNRYGNFTLAENFNTSPFRGWNMHFVVADLNGDDQNDYFISTKWRPNKLLIANNNGFINQSEKRLKFDNTTNSNGAVAFDYDIDGDLDLLIVSDYPLLKLLENDGHGYFTDASEKLVLKKQFTQYNYLNWAQIHINDFNNDGYDDIFVVGSISSKPHNFLLISDKGKLFVDETEKYFPKSADLIGGSVCDIDNDGDLDIFAYSTTANHLLINNYDSINYLNISLHGINSNRDAIGTKIWIYDAGHLNDIKHLKAYRQIGASEFGFNHLDQLISHFGLNANSHFDIKVKFYGGETILLYGVKGGQTIDVWENEKLEAGILLLPETLYRFFNSKEIQYYILIVILSLFFYTISMKVGTSKYKWQTKTVVILSTVNISVFWLLLLISYESSNVLTKYFLPSGAAIIGSVIPLYISLMQKKGSSSALNEQQLKDDLLKLVIGFSHGQWALTNINSIILLLGNISLDSESFHKVQTQLAKRIETFNELILPAIKRIFDICDELTLLDKFKDDAEEIRSFFLINSKGIVLNESDFMNQKEELLSHFRKIKNIITLIRKETFSDFTCNPEDVLNAMVSFYKDDFAKKSIEIEKYKSYDKNFSVLITKHELAEIISNCIHNSVRSVKESSGKISITLSVKLPKIIIRITDNGEGIEPGKWDKIFESGYSGHNSTGIGLFESKEILKKYMSRIYVEESVPYHKTSFTIELNEGQYL